MVASRSIPSINVVFIYRWSGSGIIGLQVACCRNIFSFAMKEVAWGTTRRFLNGLVQVSRMPNVATILSAPTEDDFPCAALGPDGKLYVAYVAFTHGKDFRRREQIPEPPKDFADLAQPTGGDQVLLLRLDGDQWTGPKRAVRPPAASIS